MSAILTDSSGEKFYAIPKKVLLDNNFIVNEYQYNSEIKEFSFYIKTNEKNKTDITYLRQDDYILFTKRILNKVNLDKKSNIRESAVYMSMFVESAFIELEKNGFTDNAYYLIKSINQSLHNFYFNKDFKEIMKKIMGTPRSKEFIIKSILCKSICEKLNLKSEKFLDKMFILSMFADLGELCPYQTNATNHQENTILLLEQKFRLTEDVKQAILHHHEYNDGTGTYGIHKHKINFMARVFRVVDELFLLLKNKDTHFLMKLKEMSVSKLDSEIVKVTLSIFSNH